MFTCESSSSLLPTTYKTLTHQGSQVRNWIWYPLVQSDLDIWVNQENHHRVRKQADKILPSGGTRRDFFFHPEKYNGAQCGIPVDVNVVDELIAQAMQAGGEELMRYVELEFEEVAAEAYNAVGSPVITLETAWEVVHQLIQYVDTHYMV